MENIKESKFLLILDYMKKTFALFTGNKKVLFPILYYTISKTIIGIIFFLSLIPAKEQLLKILDMMPYNNPAFITPEYFEPVKNSLMGIPLFTFILFIIISTFGYTWLEAKIFTSIARTMPFTVPKRKSTFRTFLAFLLANIIIYLAWLVLLIPYLIVGTLTLFLGFTLVPFIIDVLLMYYKGIYVVSEHGIFASLKESIVFAWKHFILSMILQIFTLISDIAKIASQQNSSGFSKGANRLLNINSDIFENSPPDLNGLDQIESIESGISPIDILKSAKAIDFATNILIPIAIVLLIGSAIVFFVRSVILAYFAFTSTYIYCDITAADHLLISGHEEAYNENI